VDGSVDEMMRMLGGKEGIGRYLIFFPPPSPSFVDSIEDSNVSSRITTPLVPCDCCVLRRINSVDDISNFVRSNGVLGQRKKPELQPRQPPAYILNRFLTSLCESEE
jgi:hypothetical protein